MKRRQRIARNGPIDPEFMDLNTYENFYFKAIKGKRYIVF